MNHSLKYEFLEHTSEIKFKAYGRTINEVFENVVLAISDFMTKGKEIKPRKFKEIVVVGQDIESLLYNFLDEIIYLLDAENFIVKKGEVFVRGNNVKATLYGDDASLYFGLENVKAPTYSEMFVKKTDDGVWEFQAVLYF
ncbi:MAG: archease [Nanoarchaeota archaeon]